MHAAFDVLLRHGMGKEAGGGGCFRIGNCLSRSWAREREVGRKLGTAVQVLEK